MRLSFFPLLVLLIMQPVCASQSSTGKQIDATVASAKTFTRSVVLPKWVQPLAEIPATQRKDPVVIRLNETQAFVGTSSAILVNRAIQVNDQSSLGAIGQFGIAYYPAYQKLILHRLAILRAGQILDRTSNVNTRLLQRETGMESGMYGGATTVQLLLDDVRIGDTLWVTYTTEGENPVFGNRWSSDFSWDYAAPIELRRVTVLHSKQRPLYSRQLGDFRTDEIKSQIDEIGNLRRLRFEGKSIEAIEIEPSTPSDYFPARMLQFSEYNEWKEVAAWANSLFPKINNGVELKKLAQQFSKESTPTEKASAALHWVQNEIRYFSVSIGENSHRPQAPETVIKRRYGDCKDKSYLLVSLLGELGIEAHPVLLSAQAPKSPLKINATPTWFDHVIVQIILDGQAVYVDPTRNGQASQIGKISTAFPGASVLVVSTPSKDLIILPERTELEPQYEHVENIFIASFDGDATLETREIYRANYADWARVRYPSLSATEIKKEMLALYEKQYPGVTLADAPIYQDYPDQNRFEIIAHYTLPKPVSHKDARYGIDYDSQIIYNTLGIPDKVVRNYPFELPRDKYRGRYRLNITWPNSLRANDLPSAKTIDNPFFKLNEEYTYRGNYLSYLMDFQTKAKTVSAKELPDLQVQAKRLTEFTTGKFHVKESYVVAPEALSYSFRDVDTFRIANDIVLVAKKFKGVKDSEMDPNDFCDMGIFGQRIADVSAKSVNQVANEMETLLSAVINKPGAKLCLARTLFAKGEFAKSVELFQSETPLKDDSPFTQNLAWARFYSGDIDGAIGDMARYRSARDKLEVGATTGIDIANQIALLQRAEKPIPAELVRYASEIPDGPWPRPLLAMQVGVISDEALMKVAEALPTDARDLALNEAWFYIAQLRLSKKDIRGAKAALRWFNVGGIRSSDLYLLAKVELQRLEVTDANYEAGMRAIAKKDYAVGLEKLRLSADAGVANSQYDLSLAYYYGNGVKQDYAQALHWFELAAVQESRGASNMMGVVYTKGLGVVANEETAISWYKKAALLGDPDAQYNLGDRYQSGRVIPRDYMQALYYYRQSAEQGDADAQAALARLYRDGLGVKQDYSLALLWSSRASARGNADGQLQLGYLYDMGYGVVKDKKNALAFYRLAAAQGDSSAQYNIGVIYEVGIAVNKDLKVAAEWYEKAAKQGHLSAQTELGRCYLYGSGVRLDKDKARNWFEMAANDGYAPAQHELGFMYRSGNGVVKDEAKAAMYHRKAAEQGNVDSQTSLAGLLRFGWGVEKNLLEAVSWYQKAVDQNSYYAPHELGDMYENGEGVVQDYNRAIKLYRQAAVAGNGMGFISLASLYETGKGVTPNLILAYTYCQLALKVVKEDKEFFKRRDLVAKRITRDEQKTGDTLAANWKPGMPLPEEPLKVQLP